MRGGVLVPLGKPAQYSVKPSLRIARLLDDFADVRVKFLRTYEISSTNTQARVAFGCDHVKITKVEAKPIHMEARAGVQIADRRARVPLSWKLWGDKVVVKVSTDEGLVGFGAVSCVPREWGVDAEAVAYYINTYYGPTIVGEDPFNMELILERMDDLFEFRLIPQVNPFPRSAIDLALYDLVGKYCRVPVHKLIGGCYRGRIPIGGIVYLHTPERAAKDASEYAARGFKEVKLKVGASDPDTDVQNVKAIREAVGDRVGIRVDANGAWNVNAAVKTIRKLERYDILVVEQPVTRWDVEGMAEVRKRVDTAIMVDEGLHSLHDAQALIQHRACDVFNLKLQKTGGLTFCRKLAVMAESANIACFMGSEGETGIDTAAALHLVASTPNFKYCADLCGPYMYQDDVVKQPFSVKDGCLEVPTGPGLGVELDEQNVERYAIKQKT